MLNWNPSFNWTKEEVLNNLNTIFNIEKRERGSLDVEHSDAANMNDIIRWCKEKGYDAKAASGGDIIHVWIPKPEDKPAIMDFRMGVMVPMYLTVQASSPDEALEIARKTHLSEWTVDQNWTNGVKHTSGE